jgi:hypothetical protein
MGIASALYEPMKLGHTRAKVTLSSFVLAAWVCLPIRALDRWSALSQIESGDNDHAVGSAGEISRFQMRPETWQRFAPPTADWTKPEDALAIAKEAMQDRCCAFERSVHRPPTDFEFYVLWNAPAQVQRPSKAVSARAERFCNLVKSR